MKPDTDLPTAGVSGGDPGSPSGVSRHPAFPIALTILFHPDLSRVGEKAVLSELAVGQAVPVGRRVPEFLAPGQAAGRPLEDPSLSRKPFYLVPGPGGGLRICQSDSRTRVVTQGATVDQEWVIPESDLAGGAVLELSGRVVLLLHQAAASPVPAADRHGLIGDSPALERIRGDISRVADLDVPVLLRGETGTGKELVARAIHDAGPRRNAPFLGVNLGALAPSLAAAELFGAEKGSFTGSVRSQMGYFRAAQGGTLFLDEIGEAPPEIQVMLLRALETGEVQPVGQPSGYRVNARIVAATDSDLEARVKAGTFRRPLLYRLAGYEIWLSPLRERRDDIARLFFHFLSQELDRLGEGWRLASTEPSWVPPALVARLVEYDWPGNVRQLRNLTRQLVIGSRGSARLEAGPHLDRLLREASPDEEGRGPLPAAAPAGEPARRKPSAIGQDELREALRACRWDLQATARRLRISRPSLYLLIESSPGFRKAGDLRSEEIVSCHEECGGDIEAMIDRLEVSRKALVRRLRELGL